MPGSLSTYPSRSAAGLLSRMRGGFSLCPFDTRGQLAYDQDAIHPMAREEAFVLGQILLLLFLILLNAFLRRRKLHSSR